MKKQEENNLVYLIQMGGTKYFKIGITKNLNRRIKDLQTGNPLPLHAVTTIELPSNFNRELLKLLEKTLHECFAYCGQIGEWFKFTKNEQIQIIKWSEKNVIKDFESFVNLTNAIKEYTKTITNELFEEF